MKQIVNDEIDVPFDMMRNRTPTHILRFRDVGHGHVILEQLWESQFVGVTKYTHKSRWVPVPICETIENEI